MAKAGQDTRQHIVAAADRLFYERGYEATSFADIAGAVGLSRGNFYYHFRAKDEILAAVIAERHRARETMLAAWEAEEPTPAARIARFFRILIDNQAKIMAHGCPVGTLCVELAKLKHPAQGEAAAVLALFRDWLARQFVALGREAEADALALHVLMRSQGVATLAATFRDEAFVRREVADFDGWLSALGPPA